MFTDKEVAAEAMRRGALINARRTRIRKLLSTVMILVVCLVVAAFATSFPMRYPGTGQFAAMVQAPLLLQNAGGYVLTGILAFVAGVAISLVCQKNRKGGV